MSELAGCTVRASHIRAIGGVFIAAVGVWGAWTATAWSPEDGLYVTAVFSLVVVFALITTVQDLRPADAEETKSAVGRGRALRIGIIISLTFGYVLTWDPFGYAIPTVVYTLAMLLTLGVRARLVLILTPIGVTTFVLFVFGELLNIPYP